MDLGRRIHYLYYLCSKNKDTDQLLVYHQADVTAQLICAFVFAYAKSRFSHNKAHVWGHLLKINIISKQFINILNVNIINTLIFFKCEKLLQSKWVQKDI